MTAKAGVSTIGHQNMMKLFIANKNYSSWSLRPWILLTELGIEFEEQLIPFQGSATYEIFRRFSPSGKVPCLVDGDRVVWDSLAIVEYVAERHPEVWPEDRFTRSWARSAASEKHSSKKFCAAVKKLRISGFAC